MLYRKVDKRMWGDARFRRLSRPQPCGQFLWLHLLTGPHTTSLPGLFLAGEASLAEALGWSPEGFREAFGEVSRQGMAEADWKARVVWLPNALKYNFPQSPNVVKSWRAHYDELPECQLKLKALQALAASLRNRPDFAKAFAEAFGEALAGPCPNQEQEQEQEQEPPLSPPKGAAEGVDENKIAQAKPRPLTVADDPETGAVAQRIVRHYQATVGSAHPPGGAVVVVMQRLRDGATEPKLRAACDGYARHCAEHDVEPRHRQAAKTFFALDGQHTAFLDALPQPAAYIPPPEPQRPGRREKGASQ